MYRTEKKVDLDVQLGSSPVSSLSVVSKPIFVNLTFFKILITGLLNLPDGSISLESEPLGKRSVLFSSLSELQLGLERFLRLQKPLVFAICLDIKEKLLLLLPVISV